MLFWKKSFIDSKVMYGMTDCHSHILPGVDDGVKTETKACEILSYFESQGVSSVNLTPHIMEDYALNKPQRLRERFDSLCNVYHGSIRLSLGAEYMLDSSFEQHMDANGLMPIFGDHVLLETSYIHGPINLFSLIKKVHAHGYYVILAHPERYIYMDDDYYSRLKENNVKFQLNLLSLTGAYGVTAQKKAKKLLKRDYYSCMGTDIHNLKSFCRWSERVEFSKTTLGKLNALKAGIL